MRIDIILNEFSSPKEIAELGLLAESYGVNGIWTENYPSSRDAFLALAPLAAKSDRIRMGPMAVSPFEMHPLKIANSLLTLNELSSGRASILLGGGGAVLGIIETNAQRMVRAVQECIEILTQASETDRLIYNGEIYSVRGWQPDCVTQPRPLVYAGASGPKMLRMSARVADGVMMSDMPPVLMREVTDHLDPVLAARGQSRETFPVNNFWAWHIKKDKEAAYKEARRELYLRGLLQPKWLKPFLDADDVALVAEKFSSFQQAFRRGTHVIEGVPDRIIDTLIDNLTFTGGLDAIGGAIDRLKEFEELGLSEIALRVHDDQEDTIRLIGEKIIPALA